MSEFISPLVPLRRLSEIDESRLEWAILQLKALTKKGTFVKAILTIEDGTITRLEERRSKKP